MLNEGNKRDEYLKSKGEGDKDAALRKKGERGARYRDSDTHKSGERTNRTYTNSDTLQRQRKDAHRAERGAKKSTSRRLDDMDRKYHKRFPEDKPKGTYEKMSSAQVKGRKEVLQKKGEKRRGLRSQAVRAISRSLGGGYASEGTLKTFKDFIAEAAVRCNNM